MYAMTAKDLGYIAVSTALIAVSSWIALPLGGIPVTLQTLAVCLTAALLGWRRAVFAIVAYLALGGIGVPVFAGFTGGVGKLLSPTGGYLFGFLLTALFVGGASKLVKEKSEKKYPIILWGAMLLGVLLCYILGTIWFALISSNGGLGGFWGALVTCVLPYLPFDFIKTAFAAFLAQRLKKYVK